MLEVITGCMYSGNRVDFGWGCITGNQWRFQCLK